MTQSEFNQKIQLAAAGYREIQYTGPALDITQLPEARPFFWRPLTAVAAAASVIIVFTLMLGKPNQPAGGFGESHSERYTPYQALSLARRALNQSVLEPEQGSQAHNLEAGKPPQPQNIFRLPPAPKRTSGFATAAVNSSPPEVS